MYWCDFKFKYYLLWTHILPILAHLLRHGSQTIKVTTKLLKKTIRDVVRVSKKRGMGIKLSECVAVRLPMTSSWLNNFGLGHTSRRRNVGTQVWLGCASS